MPVRPSIVFAALVVAVAVILGVAVPGIDHGAPEASPTVALGNGPVAPDGKEPAPPSPPPPPPAPSPSPSPAPPPVPASRTALEARLKALLAREDLAIDGTVGVVVRDEHGRLVVSRDADAPVLPASTMKLVTAAAALRTFGPQHRFTTTARVAAPVVDGTLTGDLYLVGGGDPALGTPAYGTQIYPARPRTHLEDLADAITAAGIRHITGRVVGDGGVFGGPSVADGWKDRYFWDFDARHITGLTVDAGLAWEIDGTPEDAPLVGTPPPDADLTLHIAPNPVRRAAQDLTALLTERGVTVAGAPISGVTPANTTTVASIESAPLVDLLRHTLHRSDNQMADTFFRDVGAARGAPDSWAGSAAAVREALADLPIAWDASVLVDGSGLSRDDRVSADLLASVDLAMSAPATRDEWRSLMAVAGEAGTLRHRLRDTIGQGHFFGKTGTLDDVKALAGTVVGPGDRTYHLAVVANDASGAEQTRVRRLMDQLVIVLAADLDGCDVVEVPPPSEHPEQGVDVRAACGDTATPTTGADAA